MRKGLFPSLVLTMSLICGRAAAWWDEGHMQIAALAYEQLTPAVREKVDALIRLNPEYASWSGGWPAVRAAQYAFVRAATWADDIKTPAMGYTDDGNKPKGPNAGRNIGYFDHLTHKYWHYKDIPFTTDGSPLDPADPVNAATQIKMLAAGLSPSSGLPDGVRSYDLVWLIHLVGDAHQPLHATSRFSQQFPHGDDGGNSDKEKVTPANGGEVKLHAYWDSLLGGSSTPEGAILDALVYNKLPDADATQAAESDPDVWFDESEKLAEQFAYAEPLRTGTSPFLLTRDYETKARDVARKQAALAAARLANLVIAALK